MKIKIAALCLALFCASAAAKVISAQGNVTAVGLGSTSANAISRISNGGANPTNFNDIMVSANLFTDTGTNPVAPPGPIYFTLNLGTQTNGSGHDLQSCRLYNDSGTLGDSGLVAFTLMAYTGANATGNWVASNSYVAKNPTTVSPGLLQSFPFVASNVQSVVLAVNTMIANYGGGGASTNLYNLQVTEVSFEADTPQSLALNLPGRCLNFSGFDQTLYRIDSSSNLVTWSLAETYLGGYAQTIDVSQDLAGARQQFYRATSLGRVPDHLIITGPAPFIVSGCTSTGQVINATSYGLNPTNAPMANVKAMDAAIAAAKAQHPAQLFIPAGVYRFSTNRSAQITFAGLTNCTVAGVAGQTQLLLVDAANGYTQGSGDFLRFTNCNNLTVQDLVVGWDWSVIPISALAQIVAVNTNLWTVDLTFPLSSITNNYPIGGSMDFNTNTWTRVLDLTNSFDLSSGYFTNQALVAPNTIRLYYDTNYQYKLKRNLLNKFTVVFFSPNLTLNGIDLISSSNVLFSGVSVYGMSSVAFTAHNNQYYEYRNCSLQPPPGITPTYSGSSGFEIHDDLGHFKMIGNDVKLAGDDGLHYDSGGIAQGVQKMDTNTLMITRLFYFAGQYALAPGNQLQLLDTNLNPVYTGTITNVFWEYNVYPSSPANRVTLDLSTPLPATVDTNDFAIVPTFAGGNYFLENNVFEYGSSHGMELGPPNGIIRSNTFYRCGYPGLKYNFSWRQNRWINGNNPVNTLICDNVINECNTAEREPAALFVGAGIDDNDQQQVARGFVAVSGHPVQNVVVANNVVANSRGLGVACFSAQNIYFLNNQILTNNTAPPRDYPVSTYGDFWIEQAANLTLQGNVLSGNGGGNQVKYPGSTTTNIVVQ